MAAHWTAAGLQIDTLHVRRDDLSLELSGLLQPIAQWPLALQGRLMLPAPGGVPWALALDVQGDLLKTLNLKADSSGYLQGQLTGQLQALAENFPAQLKITADGFKASPELPDTLQLNQLELTGNGDLKNGYQLQGKASLPAEQGAVGLLLNGRVDAKGAQIAALQLDAGTDQHLKVGGQLDWQKGFSADGTVDWLDFPWHRLYPLIDEPAVKARTFVGEVHYTDGNYLGNFKADLEGPAGRFSLLSPFSGDLQQIALPQLELTAGQGKASGYLDVALKGKLRGQPAVFQAKAGGSGEQWSLAALDIRLGDNRITGNGRLEQQLAGQLDLNMPRLAQLWPQLRGQLKGRIDVAGSLKAPQGKVSLQGQQLAFADNRLQSLNLDANLDKAQRARLELKGNAIQLGETDLGNLLVNGEGDIKRTAGRPARPACVAKING